MNRLQKIQQLKETLQSTDYIALKAYEGRDVSEHGDWQQRRQYIRDSINELQAMSDDEYYEVCDAIYIAISTYTNEKMEEALRGRRNA